MDIFVKIIGILIGAVFLFFGAEFVFNASKIIQSIQKRKYGTTAQPRKPELIMARILGSLLILVGLYYAGMAILSLF
jgi:hypothetical protein